MVPRNNKYGKGNVNELFFIPGPPSCLPSFAAPHRHLQVEMERNGVTTEREIPLKDKDIFFHPT